MSRTYHHGRNKNRKVKIRAIKRLKPDLKRLSRTLIEMAETELEKDAEQEHRAKTGSKKNKGGRL